MLATRAWKRKYTPEDGDLVGLFYVPVLEDAERYDRLTGYFSATALTLAARGIEGLVRNSGHMRLVVGCTLPPAEIEAIERGAKLREQVERRLVELPLAPPDQHCADALELLAWMVARGHLDVKVAVPCDAAGRPVPAGGIFHEKAGIVTDRAGDRLAWNGSLNETEAGWQRNWESINVFTSWGPDLKRVEEEQENFARIWSGQMQRVIVLDAPEAARQDLMRFMPDDDGPPARLAAVPPDRRSPPRKAGGQPAPAPDDPEAESPDPAADRRRRVWAFIGRAAGLARTGARVGEATAAVTPWPHQVRASERLYGHWPPRLLIADEVGLGKTIQAGLLLRQAWLAGRAKRILILAPKAVLRQWQIELREKFNLNWPIYDGNQLVWLPSPARSGGERRAVDRGTWHAEPAVIASSQLLRRSDRARVLLEEAEPWDLLVLDEAHHARRRAAGFEREARPNALLRLMQRLKERCAGLVLLTATPMQVAPVEVWDLLELLGLPPDWTASAFLQFFEDVGQPNPSAAAIERMAALFRAAEQRFGRLKDGDVERVAQLSKLRAGRVLRALRDRSTIPRRQLETPERRAALAVMRSHTPVRRLVSRHTRELLRRYHEKGLLETPVADRNVDDCFVEMSAGERALYEALEDYIRSAYEQAAPDKRTAVGFVMTIYRRRLASSVAALRSTLQRHLDALEGGGGAGPGLGADVSEDDVSDDETTDDFQDAEDVAAGQQQALAVEESVRISTLLDDIAALPVDRKFHELKDTIRQSRRDGYKQAMVFTQYTDTMDFLREELGRAEDLQADGRSGPLRLMCFSGRGGEIRSQDGAWRTISRDEVKEYFREGKADLLLCTDAAAEGLNFQFCGALVNYDMPWNPMRVEQRIGRIDRLGQTHAVIRIVNLHYQDTVETDVYGVLRDRIGLFEKVVGPLQPILARLPRAISSAVLAAGGQSAPASESRASVIEDIERQIRETRAGGFDLDAALDTDVTMPARSAPALAMKDLDRVIRTPELMPPGVQIQPLGNREYGLSAPGMTESVRVTTDPAYYEQHSESVELWSPGNPLFTPPDFVADASDDEFPPDATLKEVLDG